MRGFGFAYGVFCYAAFVAVLAYGMAFVGDLGVPRSVSFGPAEPLGRALVIDFALLAVFALQHSVMARKGFKRLWTKIVDPSIERSTYVLAASSALALLFWQWRPIAGTAWSIQSQAGRAMLWGLYWLGWAIALLSTPLRHHLDLFGVRQVWMRLQFRRYTFMPFRASGAYRFVRHPMALGLLIAFWAAPHMSWSRAIFAGAGTCYTILGTLLEERDLVHAYPSLYPTYRREVPMFVPQPGRRARESAQAARTDARTDDR
jgi:protein-S-isoprenylcysteine O-methyltransferase Ste14